MDECYWCSGACSGDTTEVVGGVEVAICDDPNDCPCNMEPVPVEELGGFGWEWEAACGCEHCLAAA